MVESVKAFAWAAKDASGLLSPFHFYRRPAGDRDVQFKILYCGICYSDLHTIKNHWGLTRYPLVPGHEITGVVTQVGPSVTKVKVGDNVGVGCFVDSCRKCDRCTNDLENYCPKPVTTYNSVLPDGTVTQGGYSDVMVVDEHFIIRWPENFPMDKGAPLLCAGITTYSPLRHYGLDKPGQRIGVVGLGGLGHMAVKFAKAFGAEVTIISTSADKRKEAVESLGVDSFVVSSEAAEMQAAAGTLDGIIDTVSAAHPLEPVLRLLKHDGTMVLVGLPTKPLQFMVFPLVMSRRKIGGSMIGGMKETQEMIDFAAKHNIVANVEMISIDYVNDAIERLEKGHVKYRFVIDIEKTLKPE